MTSQSVHHLIGSMTSLVKQIQEAVEQENSVVVKPCCRELAVGIAAVNDHVLELTVKMHAYKAMYTESEDNYQALLKLADEVCAMASS